MLKGGNNILASRDTLMQGFLASLVALSITVCAPGADLAHVEKFGSGSVELVLVPCGGCDWLSWGSFMERNGRDYRMHAVSLPGMNGAVVPNLDADSRTPFLDYSANAVADYIKSLRGKKVVLVGHSRGAIVALKAALINPALISALILEDWGAVHPASKDLSTQERESAARAAANSRTKMSAEQYYSQFSAMLSQAISDPERARIYIDQLNAGYKSASQSTYEMRVLDFRPQLSELKVPMLGLFAIYPGTGAEERRQQVAELLAGAGNLELVWFENTSHWVHEEKPFEFDEAVRNFITKL